MSTPWVKARKQLVRKLKHQIALRFGEEAVSVQGYGAYYEKDIRRRWQLSSEAELTAALRHADLVYGGDFHALNQSPRAHLRILRQLGSGRSLVLALEIFSSRDQKIIEAFFADTVSEKEFLRRVRWETSWGFPWEHYRPLVLYAKAQGWRMQRGYSSGQRGLMPPWLCRRVC